MSDAFPHGGGKTFTATWQLIISAVAVMIAIAGSILTLLVNINTLGNTVVNLSARVVVLETGAITSQERIATINAHIAAIQRDLVEIETQFCAEDAMRNLTHASDLRLLAMVWTKAMGVEMQTSNAYYPRIGRCQPNADK
jgi:cell division protein FtsX